MVTLNVYFRALHAKFDFIELIKPGLEFAPTLRAITSTIDPDAINSIRGIISNPQSDRPITSKWMLHFFERLEDPTFDGSYADFAELELEEWKSRWSYKDGRKVAAAPSIPLPTIIFDPNLVNYENDVTWDRSCVVNQRVIYTDSRSTAQWANVRNNPDYELFMSCLSLIDHWARDLTDVKSVVLMGAGSPEKDKELISCLWKDCAEPRTVNVCDSSFYMLAETYSELAPYIAKHPNISVSLHCFDITDLTAWKSYGPKPEGQTLYVIFGGTVGNIHEDDFFNSIRKLSKSGDLFLIAGSIYRSVEALRDNAKGHFDKQYGDSAKSLSLNSIASFLDPRASLSDHVSNVTIKPEVATHLPELVRSSIDNTHAAVFRITPDDLSMDARSKPSKDVILFVSRRYVEEDLVNHLTRRHGFELVETYRKRKSTYPYAHLLFRRVADEPKHN